MNLNFLLDVRNLIFVALALALTICVLLWRQLDQEVKAVPPATVAQKSPGSKKDAEKAVKLADSLLGKIGVSTPLPMIQKDPFNSPIKQAEIINTEMEAKQKEIEDALKKINISSISYSETLPLAVINSGIVGEGDQVMGSSFKVSRILPDKVELRDGGRVYQISPKR